MFKRAALQDLLRRMAQPRRFIQVLAGPRQTGKTTIARQLMESVGVRCHYATADEPALKGDAWIEKQWETARFQANSVPSRKSIILILDEIQKLSGWSETVKRLWDEDSASRRRIHVILLGSSPLLVQRGLTESLAGRFEIIPVTHWSFPEMEAAFKWDLNTYIFHGGYPGAAPLITEPERRRRYILDALIETSVSRDVFLMARVDKPALLRRLFDVGCQYSGQVVSFQKLAGQLQDAGNTTTLAHYLDLLSGAGLLTGLQKYAGQALRRRGSSPKLLVFNTALMTALSGLGIEEAKEDHEYRGRLVESAVGASLINGVIGKSIGLYYWSSRNREVDYVLTKGKQLMAIEVKSSRRKDSLPGVEEFSREFKVTRKLLVGAGGIPLEDFLRTPVERLFA